MHVVFLSPHSDPKANLGERDAGGQCVYEDQLARTLAKKDVKVTVFCRDTGSGRKQVQEVSENYQIVRVNTSMSDFVPKEIIESELNAFGTQVLANLENLATNQKLILHGHYWDGAAACLRLKTYQPYQQIPFVWTPHSLGSIKRRKFRGVNKEMKYNFIPRLSWENYALHFAEETLVSSYSEKREIVDSYAHTGGTINIIQPGVAKPTSHQLQKIINKYKHNYGFLNESQKVKLLCLGRMVSNKGFHHGIQILNSLKKQDIDAHLTIVGGKSVEKLDENNRYQQQLVKLSKKFNLENRITFVPAVPHYDTFALYALHDFFLMTSEQEPFGLTTLEAMSIGTPVVAHNKGGPTEIITDGQNGSLINIKNYQATAKHITSLLRKNGSTTLARNAKKLIQQKYSWEAKVDSFLKVYETAWAVRSNRFHEHYQSSYFLQQMLGGLH